MRTLIALTKTSICIIQVFVTRLFDDILFPKLRSINAMHIGLIFIYRYTNIVDI